MSFGWLKKWLYEVMDQWKLDRITRVSIGAEKVLQYILENTKYPHEMYVCELYETRKLDEINIDRYLEELQFRKMVKIKQIGLWLPRVQVLPNGREYFENF